MNVDDLDAPLSLAVLDFVSEQELLDGGLFGCANASRRRATEVYGVSTASPCGILGFMPLLGFSLGFLTFKSRVRYWHRRRVENGSHHSSVRSSRCTVEGSLSQ